MYVPDDGLNVEFINSPPINKGDLLAVIFINLEALTWCLDCLASTIPGDLNKCRCRLITNEGKRDGGIQFRVLEKEVEHRRVNPSMSFWVIL